MNRNYNDRNSNRNSRSNSRNYSRNYQDRNYNNDDYSRYAGADFHESDSSDYGPYDINRDFDNGDFRFGKEEFGRSRYEDRNSNFRGREDSQHPGVSGKSSNGERWLNNDQYNTQRNYAENDFGSNRRDYRFGPARNNQRPYRSDDAENEYGMRNNDYRDTRNINWSRDNRSESFGEKKSFIGKGPKGYKRSDERIKEEVCETLSRNPELDASEIEVSVSEGLVTLSGTTENRRDKRMAETIIENLHGVVDVHNQIRVKKGIEGWIPGLGNVDEGDKKSGLPEGLS